MVTSNEIISALKSLNKFSIAQEIVQGANAFAFKAFHEVLGREVFLKIFYYGEQASAALVTEPKMLVKATQANPISKNVVQLFDADVINVGTDKYACLQMEYVNGPSLLTTLNKGPIGQQDAVRMVSGILHGLSNLHSKRIVHRDLKPANVVVQGETPKITDFGSAIILSEEQTDVPASKHSSLYVPPEGWQIPSRFNFQSDLYQAAMVLYELVNGPLEYSPKHYLTITLKRELSRCGKTYDDLDDFERSKITDLAIEELATKHILLAHGRKPQPYVSDKIRRIVKAGTHPSLSKRFSSVDQFQAKLSQVDVPNWRPLDSGDYLAPAWQGWDWKVISQGQLVIVKKSRRAQDAFRKVKEVKTLTEAFQFVE